jgi:hypothetical protein
MGNTSCTGTTETPFFGERGCERETVSPVGFAAGFAEQETDPELWTGEVRNREDRCCRAGDRNEVGERAGTGNVQREVDPLDVQSADSLGQPLPVGDGDRAELGDEGLVLRASREDHAGAACDRQLNGDASDAACSTVDQERRWCAHVEPVGCLGGVAAAAQPLGDLLRGGDARAGKCEDLVDEVEQCTCRLGGIGGPCLVSQI